MFCPKCGANSGDAQFCRGCGTNLTIVSDVLAGRDTSRLRSMWLGRRTTLNLFHSSRLSNEMEINGHTAVAVFGATRIDLTTARLDPGETRVNVISVFGETQVSVPDDVAVRVTGVSIFGGVKVLGRELSNWIFRANHYETPGYAQATRRLHIDATSIFSGVKIKR
jgi:predicted membrane protein